MRIVDVEPSDLPRVSARDARALTRAARILEGLPAKREALLGALGPLTVVRQGAHALSEVPDGDRGSDVVLGLTRAAGAGRLVVDGVLARRLVAVALGVDSRPDATLARLGLAERGVVAGVVASALGALGAPFSVSVVAPGAAAVAREGGVALALAVTIGAASGWARLEVPASWLEVAPARAATLGELEVEARVELAHTRLPAGDLAGLERGDAVVFDGEPALSGTSGDGRVVRVVVGAHVARGRLGRLGEEGRVTLEEGLRAAALDTGGGVIVDGHQKEVGMDRRTGEGTAAQAVDATAVLAASPIEVVAELGRLVLRGEEIAGLGPGAVLTLGRLGASPVALRVGGEVWAEGELVDVEGELGVRVTTLRRGGPVSGSEPGAPLGVLAR
jgi:flagellar motor switch/type III secretory pathway protein FliN